MKPRKHRPADIFIPGHPRDRSDNSHIAGNTEPNPMPDRGPSRVTLAHSLDSNVTAEAFDETTSTELIMSEQVPAHIDTANSQITESSSANMVNDARSTNIATRGQQWEAQVRSGLPSHDSITTTAGPQHVTHADCLAGESHQARPDVAGANPSMLVHEVSGSPAPIYRPARAAPVFEKRFSGADWYALPDKLASEDAATAAFLRAMPRNKSPSKETTFNQTYHKTTHTSDFNSRKVVDTEQTTVGWKPEYATTRKQRYDLRLLSYTPKHANSVQ